MKSNEYSNILLYYEMVFASKCRENFGILESEKVSKFGNFRANLVNFRRFLHG